jgi:prepilin-type processing-associated H-X9-DG protein
MPWIPFRDKTTRVNGLLKLGKTRISECTDGLSNTIAFGEDAGRDPRYLSPYNYNRYDDVTLYQTYLLGVNPNDPGPVSWTAEKRFWRWADPDGAFGVSGTPNNTNGNLNALGTIGGAVVDIVHEASLWPAPGGASENSQAGNNDELASFHPGGINALFGDGHVAFLKNSVSPTVMRGLVSLNGGEVLSSDSY